MAATTPFPITPKATALIALAVHATTIRLAAGTLIVIVLTTFLIGTAWDIQWHPSVGRDKALTSPHLLMLGGIAASGLISLSVVLYESWIAWRGAGINDSNSTRLFVFFRAPIGFAVSGFGALLAALAFPLDDYWHTLYGVDVTLWAPFHIMIIFSMVMVGLGATYAFASEMNRAGEGRGKLAAQLGVTATLAMTLATFLLVIPQANTDDGLAAIGSYKFALYPLILAFALSTFLISATLVTRLPGAATILALAFTALRVGMYLFVPWAMDVAVAAEGFAYRPNPPQEIITPYAYPTSILFAALAIDIVYWLMRRRGGTGTQMLITTGVITAVLGTFWDKPWASVMTRFYFPDLNVDAVLLSALPFTILAAIIGAGVAVLLSRGLSTTRQ